MGVAVAVQAAQASASSLRDAQNKQSSLQRAVLGDLKCVLQQQLPAFSTAAWSMVTSSLMLSTDIFARLVRFKPEQHETATAIRHRALASASQGVQDTLETVATYQQRSDAVLTHLLGRSYRAADVLFYLAGGAAALGAGAAPLTRSARLPLLAVFSGALAAERLGLDWLQPLTAAQVQNLWCALQSTPCR
jgi:hypothetical protein